MSTQLPNWVIWLQALSVPVGVATAILFGALNFYLSFFRRRDDFFFRRMDAISDATFVFMKRMLDKEVVYEFSRVAAKIRIYFGQAQSLKMIELIMNRDAEGFGFFCSELLDVASQKRFR